MSNECEVNCWDHPDAVDKINGKCVWCKRDLTERTKEVFAERQAAAEAEAAEQAKKDKQQLTDEQIAERRAMADAT